MNNENKENIYSVERTHKVDIASDVDNMDFECKRGEYYMEIHYHNNILTVMIKLTTCRSDINDDIIEKIVHVNNDICKIYYKWLTNDADIIGLFPECMEDIAKILNNLIEG